MICPSSMRPHAERVLRGEYALPPGYELSGVRTVLDIGANVGAFSLWALKTWPGCAVFAFEPSPSNADLLRKNTIGALVHVTQAGVGAEDAVVTFFAGKNNCGETSRHDLGEQNTDDDFHARIRDAAELPDCDVLKVDTEGCELEIIGAYLVRRDAKPAVIMLEWHRMGDRWLIGALLVGAGYECLRDEVRRPDRGTMVWVQA
jgi:FkbM family methyltransferase